MVLKSGERIESSDYKVLRTFRALGLRDGGEKRNVSFGDISAILDSSGSNVTSAILGENHRPSQPDTVELRTARRGEPATKQLKKTTPGLKLKENKQDTNVFGSP